MADFVTHGLRPVTPRRGNRFDGNTTVVAQRRFRRDSRYAAGGYDEMWVKVPKAVAWAILPGQRFVFSLVDEGVLLRPEVLT